MARAEIHLHIGRLRAKRPDCISLREIPNMGVRYVGTVALSNVKFAVQPAGQRKAREEGVKNVHAFIRGDLIAENGGQEHPKVKGLYRKARYNPQTTDTFVDVETGEPLYEADAVIMAGSTVYYIPRGTA